MKLLSKWLVCICVLLYVSGSTHAQPATKQETLHHVLLLKWKQAASADVKSNALAILQGMPVKVEGFEQVEIHNLSFSSGEFDVIIIGKFSSDKALKDYEAHTDHKKFVEAAGPIIDTFSVNDYWK